jgi:Flp pilus assembly pilin Flp
MDTMGTTEYVAAMVLYLRARFNVGARDEQGLTTLEIAIWAAVLSAIAITVGALIVSKINSHANNIQ